MASSDFSSTYMLGVRLVAFPSRPGTRVRAWMRPPRFRAKNFSTCTRSPTARGSSHASHSPWDDVAFSSTEGDRHLGIRPVYRGRDGHYWPPTGSPEAVARPRLPQNVACGFPAPRSSAVGSQLSLLSVQVSFPWSADLLLE